MIQFVTPARGNGLDHVNKTNSAYAFGPFRLDPSARTVTRDGAPVVLSARAFDVLTLLVQREGGLVTRDQILAQVWRGVTVEENNLTVQISALRRALGDLPDRSSVIVTIPNQGYRLACAVTRLPETAAPVQAGTVPAKAAPTSTRRVQPWWLAAACCLGLLGGAGWWLRRAAPQNAAVPSQAPFANIPRLSIVIMPFRNLANDHQDDPLADAVSDDLTTEMAHMPASTVISRETADSFKGRAVPTSQIAQQLNVRYVLEGSLRELGNAISVNAQLIEASTGQHIWAERFQVPRMPADQVQPSIVYRIASALRTELVADEARRSLREQPDHPDAMDLYLRARALWDREESLPGMESARPLLEQAIRLQPDFVPALAELGSEIAADVAGEGPAGMTDRVAEGHRVIDHALGLARNDPYVLAAQGFLLADDGNMEAADASFQAALAIDPGNRRALTGGWIISQSLAHWQTARDQVLRLKQIDPEGPGAAFRDEQLGVFDLLLGRPDAAVEIERGVASWPAPGVGPPWDAIGSDRLMLAAALKLAGDPSRAKAMLEADEHVFPHRSLFRVAAYMSRIDAHDPGMQRVFAALRQSGLPDFNSEYEDDGVAAPSTPQRHGDLDATPMAAPGIPTIDTPGLAKLRQDKPGAVLIDMGTGMARPIGALAGDFDPLSAESTRKWLRANAASLKTGLPIVVFGDGAFGWRAYNGVLQLRQAGMTGLIWYRGGEEAWAKAGLPAQDTRKS
jgi:TolB-like protein/DNA-binding winged helix-turn-helix (wHTH) protein/Flp pilus assembly protein TadD/rhodanese-related sulfurtransferase